MKVDKLLILFSTILIFILCTNRTIYLSFNNTLLILRKYNSHNVKIFSGSELTKEFKNIIANYTSEAISIYSSLDNEYIGKNHIYIAFVDSTCGIGCARIGKPGIEITNRKLEIMKSSFAKYGYFDSLIFYELGRNFWQYDNQLCFSNSYLEFALRDGFAIFMRLICINKLKIDVDSINGLSVGEYQNNLKQIFLAYRADDSLDIRKVVNLNLLSTLKGNISVNQGTFWASLFYYIYEQPTFGDKWLNTVFKEVAKLDRAASINDVLSNFYQASNMALGYSLRSFFTSELKWIPE